MGFTNILATELNVHIEDLQVGDIVVGYVTDSGKRFNFSDAYTVTGPYNSYSCPIKSSIGTATTLSRKSLWIRARTSPLTGQETVAANTVIIKVIDEFPNICFHCGQKAYVGMDTYHKNESLAITANCPNRRK